MGLGLSPTALVQNPGDYVEMKGKGVVVQALNEGRLPGQQPSMRYGPLDTAPVAAIRAAHTWALLLNPLALAAVVMLVERPWREVLLVWGTAFLGQLILGWVNDLVDIKRDRIHHRSRKPLATEHLDADWMWFCVAVAACVLVPLSMLNGVVAGLFYLGAVVVGVLGTVLPFVRRTPVSFIPWAATYGMYAYFLAESGWGGGFRGYTPEPVAVAGAAMIGLGVHLLTAVRGLVADNRDGWTYLPLLVARATGAFPVFVAGFALLLGGGLAVGLTWELTGFPHSWS